MHCVFVVVAGVFLLHLQIIHTVISLGDKRHPSLAASTLHPSFHHILTGSSFPASMVQEAGGSGLLNPFTAPPGLFHHFLQSCTEMKDAYLFVSQGLGFICFIFSEAHPGNQKLPMKCLQACCSQILEELVLPVV